VPTVVKEDLDAYPLPTAPYRKHSAAALLVILQGELNSAFSFTNDIWLLSWTTLDPDILGHSGTQSHLKCLPILAKRQILLQESPRPESHGATPIRGDYLRDYTCFSFVLV